MAQWNLDRSDLLKIFSMGTCISQMQILQACAAAVAPNAACSQPGRLDRWTDTDMMDACTSLRLHQDTEMRGSR